MLENNYSFYDEVAPEGYDLLGADQKELDRYGIPPRPDADTEPRLRDFWNKLVSAPFHAKQPTFENKLRPPPKEPAPDAYWLHTLMRENLRDCDYFLSRGGTVQSSLNWSGAIISPPWPKRFILATAGWKAPSVRAASQTRRPIHVYPDDPKVLIWVGLDGYNGRLPGISLPQIGTAHSSDGTHFAWWDWWWKPRKEEPKHKHAITEIKDFDVRPDDEILAGLTVLASQDVLFFIKNQRTGQFRSFLANKPPSDIRQLGSSAEWVVERPTEPHSLNFHTLADYGSVDFDCCMAVAADGPEGPGRRLMTLADNGRMMKMREVFPPRVAYVSRAKRRRDKDGSIGVTCTFHEP